MAMTTMQAITVDTTALQNTVNDNVATNKPLYAIKNLGKEYVSATDTLTILQNSTLDILQGETISIIGASGAGKSSFLHMLGTLAMPSWGDIFFNGEDIVHASPQRKAQLRNKSMGFVFQFHHLLSEFSTLENVAMPSIISGKPKEQAFEEASCLLKQVGLEKRASFNVTLLSGGERQRAALARAVLQKPLVLLADEPTGNLDEKNGRMVADLMVELNEIHKMTMIIVTHNPELAACMSRCLEIKSGGLYDQTC